MKKRAWKRIDYKHAADRVYAGGRSAGDTDAAGGSI